MSFKIISPVNSFVDFNEPTVITCLEQPDISLPAFNDFGIQFQFQVSGDLPAHTPLKVVITDADGEKLLDQNVLTENLCYQYRLSVLESQFPLTVNAGQVIAPGNYSYVDFLTALSTYIGLTIPSSLFEYCCLFPEVTIASSVGNITFGGFWNYGFVIYPTTRIGALLQVNNCFRYAIADAAGNILAMSNKFRRVADTCFSTLLAYWNDDDAFGFNYPTPAFYNTIRLPFSFRKPVFPVTEQIYTRSDGSIFRASSRVSKEYEGYTDVLTEYFHEKLIVSLKHDHVQFTNSDIGLVAKELFVQGDYKPDWPDDNTVVVAPAKFKISVPISNINSNCYSQNVVPCCPPFLLSSSSDDSSFTVNVDFGIFVTSWNLRYRLPNTQVWTTITGLMSKSYTVNNLGPGVVFEYQLQSVCGGSTSNWSQSYIIKTTGTVPITCDGAITSFTATQDSISSSLLTWTVTGSAVSWLVAIDQFPPLTSSQPSSEAFAQPGDHTVTITPVCLNGGTTAPQIFHFTIAAPPSFVQVGASTNGNGPGSLQTQRFQVGGTITAGNIFTSCCYGYCVIVTAVSGDTATSITSKLAAAINATTRAQWDIFGSVPPVGTNGFPPVATIVNGTLVITFTNDARQFSSAASIN